MKKTIINMFLAMVLLFSFCIPAMASNTVSTNSVENVTINTSQPANGKLIFDNATNEKKNVITPSTAADVITVSIARNGDTDNCQVYLNWGGNAICGGWRFLQMQIKNTSILFPTTYGTFGNGSSYLYYFPNPASSAGSVYIGDVSIPTNVSQVNVYLWGLQGYDLSTASWISAYFHNGTVNIN